MLTKRTPRVRYNESNLQTNTSRRKKRSGRRYARFFIVLLTVLGSLTLFFLLVFFRLEHVFLTGDFEENGRYSREKITAAAELTEGERLILLNRGKLERELPEKLPYIEAVDVKIHIPNILELKLTTAEPAFCIQAPDSWYLLDSHMKVLEPISRRSRNYPQLSGFSVKACAPGKTVDFGEDELSSLRMDIVRQILQNENIDASKIQEIDVADVYFIKLSYDGRFEVWVGDHFNLDDKFALLGEIVNQPGNENAAGRIDLTVDGRASLQLG